MNSKAKAMERNTEKTTKTRLVDGIENLQTAFSAPCSVFHSAALHYLVPVSYMKAAPYGVCKMHL